MLNFVDKYFWIFFALGMILGIFLPQLSFLSPYIMYLVMLSFFLSCLTVKFDNFLKSIKDFKTLFVLIILVLVLIPVLSYLIFNPLLETEYWLAFLILAVMPTGMMVPAYSVLLKSNTSLAIILSVITTILAPFTIPFLIYSFTITTTNIQILDLFISLSMIIFIPFILAIFIKMCAKRIIKKTKKYYSSITVILATLIIIGALAKVNVLASIKSGEILGAILPFFLLFVFVLLLYVVGYFVVYMKDIKTRITSSMSVALMNSTLAIVLASQFFGPKTLLIVTLFLIPSNVGLIVFGYLVRNRINLTE